MTKTALVLGGGVAGIRAALDLAEAGAQVMLVEKNATVGGKMAHLLRQDPSVLHSSNGTRAPRLSEIGEESDIEVLTLSDVTGLAGKPGRFTASIRRRARFVTDACTQCAKCRQVCPVVLPNEYESDMSFRKAIYTPFREAWPQSYLIDVQHCLNSPPNYVPCQRCVEVCEDGAIHFDMPLEQTFTREVGSVIITVGYDLKGAPLSPVYRYGEHPDILTAMELESLMGPGGPAGGFVERPSNGATPSGILMVLAESTVFAWSCVAAQVKRLIEQEIPEITVVHGGLIDAEACSDLARLAKEGRLILVHGSLEAVDTKLAVNLDATIRNAATGKLHVNQYEMIVLNAEARPPEDLKRLADLLQIQLRSDGFIQICKDDSAVSTSRPGIYVAGCASGPKDVSLSLSEAKEATTQALKHLKLGKGRTGGKKSSMRSGAGALESNPDDSEVQDLLQSFLETLIDIGEHGRTGANTARLKDNSLIQLGRRLSESKLTPTRVETDELGDVAVPAESYYGTRTARALDEFGADNERLPRSLIRGFAVAKMAAARANRELGLLEDSVCESICLAGRDLMTGRLDEHILAPVWESGEGWLANTNINEVLANRSAELSGIHIGTAAPSFDHVDCSQSPEHVYTTAMHIAAVEQIRGELQPAFEALYRSLSENARQAAQVRLRDPNAAPALLSNLLGCHAEQASAANTRIAGVLPKLYQVALQGACTSPDREASLRFEMAAAHHLADLTGSPFEPTPHCCEVVAAHDAVTMLSGALKSAACSLLKIANDFRALATPHDGANERNAVLDQCDAAAMAAIRIVGNDVAISMAGAGGRLNSNAHTPVVAYTVLQSIRLLKGAAKRLTFGDVPKFFDGFAGRPALFAEPSPSTREAPARN